MCCLCIVECVVIKEYIYIGLVEFPEIICLNIDVKSHWKLHQVEVSKSHTTSIIKDGQVFTRANIPNEFI